MIHSIGPAYFGLCCGLAGLLLAATTPREKRSMLAVAASSIGVGSCGILIILSLRGVL